MKTIKKVDYKRFLRYIIVSVFTTIINIMTYLLCVKIFSINELVSNVMAWILSVFITFFLNRQLVFKIGKIKINELSIELLKFYLLRISSLVIDTLVLYICLKNLQLGDFVSKLIANMGTTFNNYFIGKHFIFKNTENH